MPKSGEGICLLLKWCPKCGRSALADVQACPGCKTDLQGMPLYTAMEVEQLRRLAGEVKDRQAAK